MTQGVDRYVWINGTFWRADRPVVGASDRGLLYGDGLFETIRVHAAQMPLWHHHINRLKRGLDLLGIDLPYQEERLRQVAIELLEVHRVEEGVIRIHITRGPSGRGYVPQDHQVPSVIISLHSAPEPPSEPALVGISSWRIFSADPLRSIKCATRLTEVLAAREAKLNGWHDAVLLNERNEIVESTCCNVFWIRGQSLHTPPLSSGALPGIGRLILLKVAAKLGLTIHETPTTLQELLQAEELVLVNSIRGPIPARLVGRPLLPHPITNELRKAFEAELSNSPSEDRTA